jgi:hypothetical protein
MIRETSRQVYVHRMILILDPKRRGMWGYGGAQSLWRRTPVFRKAAACLAKELASESPKIVHPFFGDLTHMLELTNMRS